MRLDEVPVVAGVDGEGEHSLNHPGVLPGAPKVKRFRRCKGTRTENGGETRVGREVLEATEKNVSRRGC